MPARHIIILFGLAAFVAMGCMPRAAAYTETVHLGDTAVSVFAPDWIWQRREVNLLFVVRNEGDAPIAPEVTLRLPEGLEEHFTFTGDAIQTVTVAPGESARGAFTGILAQDGVPCQRYDFQITVRAGDASETLHYPLKTIRGAVVGAGSAAIALPVIIALAFTLLFAFVLNAMGGPGAWLRLGSAVTAPEDRPGWIDEKPL